MAYKDLQMLQVYGNKLLFIWLFKEFNYLIFISLSTLNDF